jgi:MOSC domain-containing protein YiiM
MEVFPVLLFARPGGITRVVMNTIPSTGTGRVASLHLHPLEPGTPLQSVDVIEAIAEQGLAGEPRYFCRINQTTGKPNRRQVSLIEREQVAQHATSLGLEKISPGAARANIETQGVDLIAFVGQQIEIGDAVLFLYEARKPCQKMDAVCAGLRALMENNRQGVLAEVIKSGRIRVDDPIRPVKPVASDQARA